MVPDMLSGTIAGYSVQYGRAELNSTYTEETNSTDLVYTITGLIPNTEYVFRVRASTVAGAGPWSDHTSGFTSMLFAVTLSVCFVKVNFAAREAKKCKPLCRLCKRTVYNLLTIIYQWFRLQM